MDATVTVEKDKANLCVQVGGLCLNVFEFEWNRANLCVQFGGGYVMQFSRLCFVVGGLRRARVEKDKANLCVQVGGGRVMVL